MRSRRSSSITSRSPPSSTRRGAVRAGSAVVVADAPDNVACEARHGDVAATDAAFAQAAHVVTLDLVNQRCIACPIEPRSTLGTLDAATGRLTLRVSCQTPTGLRDELCDEVLGIPKEQVRVVVGDVGGGFGMKTNLYPEDVVVAFAVRELKRPVKFTAERMEEFLAASHGRDVISTASLALDAQGKVLALRVDSLANVGAYATPAGVVIQLLIGPWVSTSIYDIRPDRHPHPRGAHAYRADRRVSRRRPSRGDLPDRAPDGRGRAADRHRPRRAAPPQPDPARRRCRTATRWTRPTTPASSSW